MGELIRAYIDESLVSRLEKLRKQIAEDLKKKYKLEQVTIHGSLTSQVLAAQNKDFKFKIKKTGYRTGVLHLL